MKTNDLLDKLIDLQRQATTEHSHFYVATCITEAIQEILSYRQDARALYRVIENEGCWDEDEAPAMPMLHHNYNHAFIRGATPEEKKNT